MQVTIMSSHNPLISLQKGLLVRISRSGQFFAAHALSKQQAQRQPVNQASQNPETVSTRNQMAVRYAAELVNYGNATKTREAYKLNASYFSKQALTHYQDLEMLEQREKVRSTLGFSIFA